MLAEVGSKNIEQVVRIDSRLLRVRQIIDRLVEWLAEHQAPDSIDDRAVKAAVVGMSHPRGELRSLGPCARKPLGMEGDAGRDFAQRQLASLVVRELGFRRLGQFGERAQVFDRIRFRRIVFDADRRDFNLAVACRQSLELPLFPSGERMVVTLGAVDALAEERADRPARQLVLVDPVVVRRGRDEVDFGHSGPQAAMRDHAAHHFVIRPVLMKLLTEPRPEAVSPEQNELTVIGPDEDPREPAREVVGKATIGEQLLGPAFDPLRLSVGLEQPNLFERRHRPVQHQRQSPQ